MQILQIVHSFNPHDGVAYDYVPAGGEYEGGDMGTQNALMSDSSWLPFTGDATPFGVDDDGEEPIQPGSNGRGCGWRDGTQLLITPKKAKKLSFKTAGGWVHTNKVNHPGLPKREWFGISKDAEKQCINLMEERIERELRRA